MDRREHDRIPSDLPGLCRAPATPRRVRLVDVSSSGCRIRTLDGAAIPYGATALLDVAGARVSGQVVWSGANSAGIRFDSDMPQIMAIAVGLEESPVIEMTHDIPAYEPVPYDSSLPHWLRRLLRRAA